jgi:DMSO/TMAO reductase YedYZ heme-binding membrane subunit
MFGHFNNMSHFEYEFWKFQMTALAMGFILLVLLIVWIIDSCTKWCRKRGARWRRKQPRR